MEGKSGRSGHYIKKKSKEPKKFTSDEQEHDEMLRVAKVKFIVKKFPPLNFYNLIEITIT
jgi:hypothetical protein